MTNATASPTAIVDDPVRIVVSHAHEDRTSPRIFRMDARMSLATPLQKVFISYAHGDAASVRLRTYLADEFAKVIGSICARVGSRSQRLRGRSSCSAKSSNWRWISTD